MNWNSNLFWCIAGAILSLIITTIFRIIDIKRKKISYSIKTKTVILHYGDIDTLDIKCDSISIENLYYSIITFKNIGNTLIESNDVSPQYPLALYTKGIIKTHKDYPKPETNEPNCVVYKFVEKQNNNLNNKIVIDFDYFSPHKKIICRIFHTNPISFHGFLKKGKIINKDLAFYNSPKFKTLLTIVEKIGIYILGCMSAYVVFELIL